MENLNNTTKRCPIHSSVYGIDEINEEEEPEKTISWFESLILPEKKLITTRPEVPEIKAYVVALEITALVLVVLAGCYLFYRTDNVVLGITKGFAYLGHPNAQHIMGERCWHGRNVVRNFTLALQWFKLAADQGYASSAYTLAVGHLQGYKSPLKRGEARELLKYAASRGVTKASHLLDTVCSKGKECDR